MSRTGIELGIAAYIDNSDSMLDEFSWLYKSWIYSGCWKSSDLIIVHHPALSGAFPQEPGIITVPAVPHSSIDPLFDGYHFINSIACLSGPHVDDILRRYRWILRTDADVFLTENLARLKPTFPIHGRGHYHWTSGFREGMLDFCRRHGINHQHNFGCGASLLIESEQMILFLRRQMFWARRLAEDFGSDSANWGVWPRWYRGVMSMYAAEIVANERSDIYLSSALERILDTESTTSLPMDTMTLHIHAVHGSTVFSKFKYRAGEYRDVMACQLDRKSISGYCLWIVLTPIESIKILAGYPA